MKKMCLSNILASNNKKLRSERKETRISFLGASIHQTGMVELPLNMKKERPMVKLTVIIEQVFQTVQVIKMIEPREESRDVPRIVRKEVRIVLLANGLIINQTDKLISWLINNNQREKLVTPTNNMSERPKEAHKVQV